MDNFIETGISEGISYQEYINLINSLVAEEKTTGTEQSAQRIGFTKLNASRMRRLDKTVKIPYNVLSLLQKINEKQTWLVLLESWCADGAQTIPVLNKLAEIASNIDLKIVLRDEHPELMDNFLTNGTRSIPKLIILNANYDVITSWGPRSTVASQMVAAYKKEHGKIDDSFKEDLQVWYNKDKGVTIINELIEIIEIINPVNSI